MPKKFMLDIPQAKKHGQTNFRDDFVTVEIDEELALLFTNQANATLRLIEKQVGELPVELKEDMPLFAAPRKVDLLVSVDDLRNILAKTPDRLHMSRNVALKILHSLSAKCDAKSERLEGEYIRLTTRRFRYTLGTNAARRGLSLSIIAKVLHHSDTQNASVYTENVKELTEEVNEALAPVLAPLAQAFSGQLIDSEADAIGLMTLVQESTTEMEMWWEIVVHLGFALQVAAHVIRVQNFSHGFMGVTR